MATHTGIEPEDCRECTEQRNVPAGKSDKQDRETGRESVRLLPGTVVEVRPWPEIAATLDASGKLDGLPFMAEMVSHCGARFTVRTRVERTCEESQHTMRRMRNAVFLDDLRCDGSAHSGCRKACMIFWKEAWLQQVRDADARPAPSGVTAPREYPYSCSLPGSQFSCQATELVPATSPLPRFDVLGYWRDLRAKNHSLAKLCRLLAYAGYLRLRELATGRSARVLQGSNTRTPTVALHLNAGEWVQVRPRAEILTTLDRRGKNRGLAFTTEMLPFCGKSFRVRHRVNWIIDEGTRRLIPLENTVVLENVTCNGCSHLRGGCPRENFHFWHEIWLRRVAAPPKQTLPLNKKGTK